MLLDVSKLFSKKDEKLFPFATCEKTSFLHHYQKQDLSPRISLHWKLTIDQGRQAGGQVATTHYLETPRKIQIRREEGDWGRGVSDPLMLILRGSLWVTPLEGPGQVVGPSQDRERGVSRSHQGQGADNQLSLCA